MSDNGNHENEPTVIKHTHYTPSLAATIVDYLLMPRPPLEEGGEPRPPQLPIDPYTPTGYWETRLNLVTDGKNPKETPNTDCTPEG